jgi:glycosyltransferase involved in cell wall biosynthesis
MATAHVANVRIKIVDLSRNFGKEAALTAGLEYANGDVVVPLDADLQDPPELIPELVAKWREGYDMVVAVRRDRGADSLAKRTSAGLFYRVIRRLSGVPVPAQAGDFRLIDRRVVEALKLLPERTRFMKGLFAWVGFRQATISYARPARVAGSSKWRYWKLWNFALDGLLSSTTLPLRIWTYLGLVAAVVALSYMLLIVLRTLVYGVDVPGYASLAAMLLFFSGMNMIGLGIMGEYLGRVFIEVKQRPQFLVRQAIGFDPVQDRKVGRPAAGNAAVSGERRRST